MRKIFKWQVAEESATVTTLNVQDSRILTPYGDIASVPGEIVLRVVESPDAGILNDFPYSGSEQPRLLSARALSILKAFLQNNGVIVPVTIEDASQGYFAFIPKKIIDCIDETTSRIRETTYVRFIEKAIFKPVEIAPTDVFVAKGFEKRYIWVTDKFVETVRQHELVGAEFN